MENRLEGGRAGLALITAGLLILAMFALYARSPAGASGDGSSAACNTGIQAAGTQDLRTHDAGAGFIVSGVCIKSGSNMFLPDKHSGVLGNGTYENGCYEVSGVGTQNVSVERIGEASDQCQGLSHVDVLVSSATTTTTDPTTTTTVGATTTTVGATTTTVGATTTTVGATTTTQATITEETTTTIEDEVLGTVVTTTTAAPTTTVEDEVKGTHVLPFTGIESDHVAMLAMALVAGGILTLVGSQGIRHRNEE